MEYIRRLKERQVFGIILKFEYGNQFTSPSTHCQARIEIGPGRQFVKIPAAGSEEWLARFSNMMFYIWWWAFCESIEQER